MWVNKQLFDTILTDNKTQAERLSAVWNTCHVLQTKYDEAAAQKIRDASMLDWLRHRVNALEKQNAIMLAKISGVHFPVSEIVPSKPHTLEAAFDHLPSFEDVGDGEVARLGLDHDEYGALKFTN